VSVMGDAAEESAGIVADPPFDLAVPHASALLESLRGVGYSAWAAVADLVDNSIAAGATRIRVDFIWRGTSSCVRIIDDGNGMDEAALIVAMRPGSRTPAESRGPHDLGRFGLGLKTASLSQCRVLTVVSRTSAGTAARRWDLDHVARVNDWQLLLGAPDDAAEDARLPAEFATGTLVLWTKLDRLAGHAAADDEGARRRFFETARHVERHLAMTHHRFLAGSRPRVQLFFCGDGPAARVEAWDPFLQWHPATIATPPERIPFVGSHVEVQGFVLPHRDRLTAEQLEAGGGPEGWLAHEGFYVYRAERLLVYGGWLYLGDGRRWARDELHRLARIRVDLPNTTDHEWKIDIRKSIAIPPAAVRSRLRGLAERVRADARDVLAHRGGRGPRSVGEPVKRAWIASTSARGTSYRIDRSHPAVRRALDCAGEAAATVEDMLYVIEATVPVQRIWLDATERGDFSEEVSPARPDDAVLRTLRSLYRHLVDEAGLPAAEAKDRLLAVEPFDRFPAAVAALSEKDSP